MGKTKTNKVWGTRMKSKPSELLTKINASIDVDKELYQQDINGSIAHCKMLAKQKIIKSDISKKIVNGLEKIRKEIQSKKFKFSQSNEDIHLNIEKRLFEIIGPNAGFLHIARSRNDQVTTDFKLWVIDASQNLNIEIKKLIKALIKLAEKNKNVIMPGFTHLKNAQPVLFSHYLLAYIEMFKRDHKKFTNVIKNTSENPLGSAALAGTGFAIDRFYTSKQLGFLKPTDNSIDGVSDRDYAIEFLFVSSLCSMHLSRLAEEIILWNSDIVNMININDKMLTGSSIMPQKKNPDGAELLRGKSGAIYGNLNSLLVTMKGLPLSYFKDMQEDKKPVFETFKILNLNLKIAKELVESISPNKAIMKKFANYGYTTATDFADYLVKKGLSFREAHKKSAKLVNIAEKKNLSLNELSFSEIKKIDKLIKPDVIKALKIENSVNSKTSYGGTSIKNVVKMLKKLKKEFK
ncbi:MAG: argininosuccinate lyase [Pelagibacteraceae bacterium]|jgi:argininosuccinate lyase|uniref:argininosuccinate lyase n=1 Tax=Candidatus Pelagibacter sp. HIMB109 TaxID=3415412 RepID=UPI0031248E1F|tara:strand:+ start:4582 stop:5970 length:1389 start_codon:yes stop_codon:yes gene_type:complete